MFTAVHNQTLADAYLEYVKAPTPAAEGVVFRTIPTDLVSAFLDRAGKLARRAGKLGVPAPQFDLVADKIVEYTDPETGRKVKARGTVVRVELRAVKLPGYRFVATIQHVSEVGNIIRTVPGLDVVLPKSYREADASWCDHCRTVRARRDTFVVTRTEGPDEDSFLRIGRNCLQDFVGGAVDPSAGLGFLIEVGSFLDDEGWGFGGGRSLGTEIESYVAQCKRCVVVEGWVSRGAARDTGRTATADLAAAVITARARPTNGNAHLRVPELEVTEADTEFARAAIEWAQAIDPDTDSDYLHNLRVACSFTHVGGREGGIIASVVSAYSKHIEAELYKARSTTPRGLSHLGKVGDKIGRKQSAADRKKGITCWPTLNVEITGLRTFESQYGARTLVTMEFEALDPVESVVFTWWASGAVESVNVGDLAWLVGTIKKHGEYKGTKQTELQRCTLTKIETTQDGAK